MAEPELADKTAATNHIVRIAYGTPAYRRMAVALLMAGFATFALLYDVQPLLPMFALSFGVNAATASLAVSFTTGTMAMALIPAAILSDRFGRRPIMVGSLFAAAGLTIVSTWLPGWEHLLLMRAAVGLSIAGLPGIAMAYVAEEMDTKSVGAAMGLYIAGSAVGGMAGRLGITLAAQFVGWRMAIELMGLAGLFAALAFYLYAPPSRAFTPVRHDVRSFLRSTRQLLCDQALPLLYAEAFLLMGIFVAVYNYLGFRLEAPPYSLSEAAAGSVFVLYLVGSLSSAWFGGLASRFGRARVFWIPIVGLAGGIVLTALQPLALVIFGVAVITASFFAAHSTASSWVGRRTLRHKAQASSLYLLFYYLGSSLLGSAGGVAWNMAGWNGVVTFALLAVAIALVIALRLATVRPLTSSETPI